jgi:hypothetical protein
VTKEYLSFGTLLIKHGWLDPSLLIGLATSAMVDRAATSPPKSYLPNSLLPPSEAAGVTGLAAKTLANYRSKGPGPVFIKTGNLIHYRYADLLTFIEKNKRSSTSDVGVAQ